MSIIILLNSFFTKKDNQFKSKNEGKVFKLNKYFMLVRFAFHFGVFPLSYVIDISGTQTSKKG